MIIVFELQLWKVSLLISFISV